MYHIAYSTRKGSNIISHSVPGVTGEIGTDDIISEVGILKNYSFADDVFELRPASIHVLNIPSGMYDTGTFFEKYNKAFLDVILRSREKVNIVVVTDPRKVQVLRTFQGKLETATPTGLAKEIKYLRDRGIRSIKSKSGGEIQLDDIPLDDLDWNEWAY